MAARLAVFGTAFLLLMSMSAVGSVLVLVSRNAATERKPALAVGPDRLR
jgi:hypothetical protein